MQIQVFMCINTSGEKKPLFKKLGVLITLQIFKAMVVTALGFAL